MIIPPTRRERERFAQSGGEYDHGFIRTVAEAEEVRRCAADPYYFILNYGWLIDPGARRPVKPFRPYPSQRDCLREFIAHPFTFILKGRQLGMSWLVAGYTLWAAIFRPFSNIQVISINQARAKRFLDRVKFIYRHLPDFLRMRVSNGVPGDVGTVTVIEFENGSRIESIPTSREAGRSETLTVLVIDEAAFVRWVDEIWEAARPTLSSGGTAIVLTTPHGLGDWTHEQVTAAISGESIWNLLLLDWRDHPGRGEEWAARERLALGEDAFAQEHEAKFLSSGRPAFDVAALRSLDETIHEDPVALRPADVQRGGELYIFELPTSSGSYVLGADTAKGTGKSYNAFTVRDRATGRQVASYRGKPLVGEYARLISQVGGYFNDALVAVELNNTGLAVMEHLVLNVRNGNGYPNLYHEVDPISQRIKAEPGWNTTAGSKTRILSKMQDAVLRRRTGIRCLRQLSEMWTTVYHGARIAARQGYSDDLVMADAICMEALGTSDAIPDDIPLFAA
ncbi:MAG: terminase family protein [Sumerlaeia bacterium]